jgi:hypothetical protein
VKYPAYQDIYQTRRRWFFALISAGTIAAFIGGCGSLSDYTSEAEVHCIEDSECSGDTYVDGESAPTLGALETISEQPDITAEIAALRAWVPGPLDQFLIRIYDQPLQHLTSDELSAHDAETTRQFREMMSNCMAEQGFELDTEGFWAGVRGDRMEVIEDAAFRLTREFAATHGFNLANPWIPPAAPAAAPPPFIDQTAGMSDAEREAFNLALHGDPTDRVFDLTNPDGWKDWGCQGLWMRAQGAFGTQNEFQALEEEVNNLRFAVDGDPEMAAVNSQWSSCMAGQGFSGWNNPDGLRQAMWIEYEGNFAPDWDTRMDEIEGWDWDTYPEGPEFLREDPEDTRPFLERELALAVADWDCRVEVRFEQIRRSVELRVQQEFVARLGPELEAWAQYAEARRAGFSE